jgi:hypothetical protein
VLTPGRPEPCVVTTERSEPDGGWLVTDPTDPEPTWRATVEAAVGEAIARASCILEDRLLRALAGLHSPDEAHPAPPAADVC